jgi:hypothetical protein
MYWRYFMWNFTGRQNDIQGHGKARNSDAVLKGNWLSGVSFVDNAHLGNQETIPESLKENPGRNKFYFLPLILGIIGMIFHFVKHREDAWVVLLLFFNDRSSNNYLPKSNAFSTKRARLCLCWFILCVCNLDRTWCSCFIQLYAR